MSTENPDPTTWRAWLSERPPAVRAIAERYPPWRLYRLRPTGQLVHLLGFSEHTGECTPPCVFCESRPRRVSVIVAVLVRFNPTLLFDRKVFGIDPEDLIEIPGSVYGEPVS